MVGFFIKCIEVDEYMTMKYFLKNDESFMNFRKEKNFLKYDETLKNFRKSWLIH